MKVVRALKAGRDRIGLIKGWRFFKICQLQALLWREGSWSVDREGERRWTIDKKNSLFSHIRPDTPFIAILCLLDQ
jgi:hypothetical protein